MKKIQLLLLCLAITTLSLAQNTKPESKWFSTAEIDFIFPNKMSYSYHIGYIGSDDEITPQGFLLKSFGVQYIQNYSLFSKLSLGALGGVQTLNDPKYVMVKVGGVLKYFFIDKNSVYLYTQISHVFSVDKSNFKKGGNLSLGLGFPVFKRDKFNINTNVFAEKVSLDLEGSDPFYGLEDEYPGRFVFSSFGISFGVQF